MLEQMFSEQSQECTSDQDPKVRNSKRRKINVPTSQSSMRDLDDDDEVYYANMAGKKGKGGIGYAGDQREDVSAPLRFIYESSNLNRSRRPAK
jgi:hypothetical protein